VWGSNAVSNIGTWMQTVAVGALVTARTGQASWTGLVAAAAFLPLAILSPIGGALADRHDRRRWLIGANLVSAALATLLALLSAAGRASPGTVTLVVFLSGCTAAIAIPFQQALLPDLVPKEDLLAAVSLGSAQYNLGRVVGPALAGGLIAATSFTWAFAVNAASFFAVIVALAILDLPARGHIDDDPGGLWTRIREGARAALAEPGCRSALLLIAVAGFLASPFIALIPAKAAEVVGGGAKSTASGTGALTTAQGVGAVLGALAVAPMALRYGRRRLLTFCLIATPVALMAYAAAGTLVLAVIALSIVGAMYIGVLSGLGTVIQLRAPTQYRARILSLYTVALGSLYPLGALVQGVIADRLSLGVATAGAAAILIVVIGLLSVTRPQILAALDDPPNEPVLAAEPRQETGPLGPVS
jgi:MFS family permease